MPKTVTFTADVYPYCLGDTVTLSDEELKAVDTIAKGRKVKAYVTGTPKEVDSTAEFDRQEADREAAGFAATDPKVAEAQVTLEEAASEAADERGAQSPSGRVTPGTAGDTAVKTAANKRKS